MIRRQASIHNSEEEEAAARYSIVYLSWHGAAGRECEDEQRFLQGWPAYIERRLETDALTAKRSDLRWIGADLYLMLPVPQALEPEEWLQRLRAMQLSLQEEYLSETPGADPSAWTLHAGISSPYGQAGRVDDAQWYRAFKEAIIDGRTRDSVEQSMRRGALRRILDEGLLYPVYQPIHAIGGGGVFGYEALSRCEDNRWFDGPSALFAYAEQEGVVYSLDRLAREKAISGSGGLRPEQKMFINISARIMQDPQFTPGQTLRLLEAQGLSPNQIVFELTERSSIDDFETTKQVLDHYRSQGYQIAIDDAGAGYSSLQSIVELRPDYIKVDRSLIRDIHEDEFKEHILETFLAFARKMDIHVIAEGIELPEELAKLETMGIDYAQGYLLGRPARRIGG